MKGGKHISREEEERDFKRRMASAAAAGKVRADFDRAEAKRIADRNDRCGHNHQHRRTPRFKIARAFRAGHGKLS